MFSEYQIPQEYETPLTLCQHSAFGYRYVYARSADSRLHAQPGQDFLAWRENEDRLSFALCDGVSQSFFGELASRFLGTALVDWFWRIDLSGSNSQTFTESLGTFLDDLTSEASAIVAAHPLPDDMPAVVRSVMEEKRALGSESTFVAGRIDILEKQLWLAWMGDSRLRLWGPEGEMSARLGDTFHTAERWSSRRGRVGALHTAVFPLEAIHYLAVYSDGLDLLDRFMSRHLRDASIQAYIELAGRQPTSDDVSYYELWLGNAPPPAMPPLPPPRLRAVRATSRGMEISWHAVRGALRYELELYDRQREHTYYFQTSLLSFDLPWERLRGVQLGRLRPWAEDVGEWSGSFCLSPPPVKTTMSAPLSIADAVPSASRESTSPLQTEAATRQRGTSSRWLCLGCVGSGLVLLAALYVLAVLYPGILSFPSRALMHRPLEPSSSAIIPSAALSPSPSLLLSPTFSVPPPTPTPAPTSTSTSTSTPTIVPFPPSTLVSTSMPVCVSFPNGLVLYRAPGSDPLDVSLPQGQCFQVDALLIQEHSDHSLWLHIASVPRHSPQGLIGAWVQADDVQPYWRMWLPVVTLTPTPTITSTLMPVPIQRPKKR